MFTGLHHSREALSLTMVFKIFLEKLRVLKHKNKNDIDIFDFNDILFVPIVNTDGYMYINSHYGKDDWDLANKIRKNLNFSVPCEFFKKKR